MTDKRQAESQQTDSDHTHVLPFLLFATQSRFLFLDVAAAIDKSAVDGRGNTCGKTSWKCAVSHLGHSIVSGGPKCEGGASD